jgi:hypothetical protein
MVMPRQFVAASGSAGDHAIALLRFGIKQTREHSMALFRRGGSQCCWRIAAQFRVYPSSEKTQPNSTLRPDCNFPYDFGRLPVGLMYTRFRKGLEWTIGMNS